MIGSLLTVISGPDDPQSDWMKTPAGIVDGVESVFSAIRDDKWGPNDWHDFFRHRQRVRSFARRHRRRLIPPRYP